jgi:hypothetical protein
MLDLSSSRGNGNQAPALLTSGARVCVCVCARTGRSRDFARVPLSRWACSRRLNVSRPRAPRGDVSSETVDGRGDDPSRVMCVLALGSCVKNARYFSVS